MSSNRSPAVEFELQPDARVRALLVAAGLAGMVLIAAYAPTGLIAAPWLVLTLLVVVGAVRAQRCDGGRERPSRLRVQGEAWMLVFADGHRTAIALRSPTARLGRWWFIHWAGGWAVITQRSIGVHAWRSLTARLREAGHPAAPRGASRAR
jgi:hypothetical protein